MPAPAPAPDASTSSDRVRSRPEPPARSAAQSQRDPPSVPAGHHRLAAVDNATIKALTRALRRRKMLDTGVHATLQDLARAMGLHATYVSRVLRLTLLAPEIVKAILDGRQPAELQLDDLLEGVPLEWEEQHLHFG